MESFLKFLLSLIDPEELLLGLALILVLLELSVLLPGLLASLGEFEVS